MEEVHPTFQDSTNENVAYSVDELDFRSMHEVFQEIQGSSIEMKNLRLTKDMHELV